MKTRGSMRKFWVGSTATLAFVLLIMVSVIAVYMNRPASTANDATKTGTKEGSTFEPMVIGSYAPVSALSTKGAGAEHFCGGDAGVCAI